MNIFTGSYTDLYQLTMGQVYFLRGDKDSTATFDYFFRKLPFSGGFAIYAGLETVLEILKDFRFDQKDLSFLEQQGFHPDFLEYLKDFQFRGSIYSALEGEVVFPTEPILRVEASIIEAQIVETMILNILNFQTLIATKAARMKNEAQDRVLVDFGLRRAQATGGHFASRAAIIGGFEGTSNVRAGRDFNIPVSGTMAHSFIQSYGDELEAFRDFAKFHSDNTVLLVDTYDTLKSGVPNAIKVGLELKDKGLSLKGIRLDSGDLAYLSKRARKMLDEAGLKEVKISVSNQLDEHLIKSLLEQGAPIDIFGVGTRLVTGNPDAALDGVYKLSFFKGRPSLKISETIAKVTLPHPKQVLRTFDEKGHFAGADIICMLDENEPSMMYHPFDPLKSRSVQGITKEPLLQPVVEKGARVAESRALEEIQAFSKNRLKLLPTEYKRFFNPHLYKVGLSEGLKNERDRILNEHKNNK